MTDYVNYVGGDPIKRSGGDNAAGYPQHSVWVNTFDSKRRNLQIADTVSEFLTIPANTAVTAVYLKVTTLEAAVTIDIGDSVDPNGFVAAQTTAAEGTFAGAGALIDTAGAANVPKFYTADEELAIVIGGAAATVVEFTVIVVGFNVG
jgi:hypothetical protein